MSRRKISLLSISLLFSLILFVTISRGAGGSESYAGPAACAACHKQRHASYSRSNHAKKAIPGSPANAHACESCHGPGSAHAARGGGRGTGMLTFSKGDPAGRKSAVCMSCHQNFRSLAAWNLSRHHYGGISCDNCHTVHSGTGKNLQAPEPGLCNTCHLTVRAQQAKQSRHPLKEGLIRCTQCHDQHGSLTPKMVKADSVNELCYKCHADKRGPFMWEHPPVQENCLNCHVPHGSNHYKLLNTKPPLLCQSCHDAPAHPGNIYTRFETFQGTAASGKNRMFARSCLNCHSNIHGSMGPSFKGEFFVR